MGVGGFVSLVGERPERKTTIGYYSVINKPITDYATVQECLQQAEKATREVGQDYVVTTFDLGVCMKAYPLIWNQPAKYQKHIILMGTFHTVCAYLKMEGKKMDGTGLFDVMEEAGLIGTGSINGVSTCKNYDRALHCHKVVHECLERLLLRCYLSQRETSGAVVFPTLPEKTITLLSSAKGVHTKSSVDQLLLDKDMTDFLSDYLAFREEVRTGQQGKTAQLWVSYMDHISLVLHLLQAVKTNDFELYAQILSQMPDLFFAFGGQNYARYLTFFSTFLANIETSHPGATDLLRRGAFSVARSMIPGNRCATDKTMEETFMRHAKSRGGTSAGLIGITTNYQAYQRWARTTSERVKYVQATFDLADMLHCNGTAEQHYELRPAEVLKGERSVKRAMIAVESFTNPFGVDPTKLVVLSSGLPVPSEVEIDVLCAEETGRRQKEAFITGRLEPADHFFDPIKQLRLKTMAAISKKVTLRSTENKVRELKQNSNIAFQLLLKSHEGNLGLLEGAHDISADACPIFPRNSRQLPYQDRQEQRFSVADQRRGRCRCSP